MATVTTPARIDAAITSMHTSIMLLIKEADKEALDKGIRRIISGLMLSFVSDAEHSLDEQLFGIGAGGVSSQPITKLKQSNFDRAAAWLMACGKEPSPANASLQIGCDLEECVEFYSCLDLSDMYVFLKMRSALETLRAVSVALKSGLVVALVKAGLEEEALDGLCDREVTGNGVAFLLGFNKPAADLAVLAANEDKLIDGKPVILAGGKIGKRDGWVAPDLSAFV